jgi:uncharacterized protein (UPF0276 family)
LLDVNNVYVSRSVNHGWEPRTYLAAVAGRARIAQLHLAGHARHDELHDRHPRSRRSPTRCGQLYAETLVARFGAAPTLLEWDADVPPLATLLEEAARARAIAATAIAATATATATAPAPAAGAYARAS